MSQKNEFHSQTEAAPANLARRRLRLVVRGRVQGVGFRPFVHGLAVRLGVAGCVGNDAQGVFIEVEGASRAVAAFCEALRRECPPLARIASISASDVSPCGEAGFRIVASRDGGRRDAAVAPDAAACSKCRAELFDPRDRRRGYAFINCTNCGPRYSIIRAIPYDRAATTMARFTMCAACRKEFEDPANRRFHAQPNACPVCGPRAWLARPDGTPIDGDPFALCAEELRRGAIAAIKGLGGFHLACRADSDAAVGRLRARKGREAKPFALMVPSLQAAERVVKVDRAAAELLESPAHPIVLLPRRENAAVSSLVAPQSPCLGVMLPYTPLHLLLLDAYPADLVMTSGNLSDEPLCRANDEALQRLRGLADVFLLHDRDIERPIDDSVVAAAGEAGKPNAGADAAGGFIPLRRARGYVPDPIPVAAPAAPPILAFGGDLKSAICLLAGGRALLSEHLGELHHPAAFRNFVRAVEKFRELADLAPEACACDMHPGYAATRHAREYARRLDLPLIEVQHHHAHAAACAAENRVEGPVVGLACDGTGFGPDGSIWGCEILTCRGAEFERAGHLDSFPLLGGDAAAIETWRPAAALLFETFGPRWIEEASGLLSGAGQDRLALSGQRLAGNSRLPRTTSLGRLFDGVAALLGLCERNRFEAEAPMALEAAAWEAASRETAAGATGSARPGTIGGSSFRFALAAPACGGGPVRIDFRPLVRGLVEQRRAGRAPRELALEFHEALAAVLAAGVCETARRFGLREAALSGGCFANRWLAIAVRRRIEAEGLSVRVHRHVPPGDGGIALGQAAVAAHRLSERS